MGVALVSDLSDLSDLSDKLVRPCIPRGFACRSLVWLGRRFTVGVVIAHRRPNSNSHNSHKRRPQGIANLSGYSEFVRRFTAGVCGQCDGNGGMRVAAAWRLHKTYKTYKTYKMMMGAPRDTPWVCGAAVGGGSECRFTVWVVVAHRRPQIKTWYS